MLDLKKRKGRVIDYMKRHSKEVLDSYKPCFEPLRIKSDERKHKL